MRTELRTCPICDVVYYADPVRLKHGRQITCSYPCGRALVARKLANAATFPCATCGTDVRRTPAQLAIIHHGIFCSRACHYAGRATGATKRIVTKPYTYTPEGKAALIAASSRPKGQRTWHMLTCAQCGTEFDDPSDGRKRKGGVAFCSLACCNTYRAGERNPAWRGGYRTYYGPDWRPLQRAARKRDGYTCQHCDITQQSIGKKLDVHHIRPVSTFDDPNEANTIDNVITLCHTCHMTLEWDVR